MNAAYSVVQFEKGKLMELKPLGVGCALLAVAFALAGCSSTPNDTASDEDCVEATDAELDSLFTTWNDALTSGDASKVAALYSPDAVLLPTLSPYVADTPQEITDYFTTLIESDPDARMDLSIKKSACGIAYNVGQWTINANGSDVHARVTWVYEYDDGKWLITHHHSSVDPAPK